MIIIEYTFIETKTEQNMALNNMTIFDTTSIHLRRNQLRISYDSRTDQLKTSYEQQTELSTDPFDGFTIRNSKPPPA